MSNQYVKINKASIPVVAARVKKVNDRFIESLHSTEHSYRHKLSTIPKIKVITWSQVYQDELEPQIITLAKNITAAALKMAKNKGEELDHGAILETAKAILKKQTDYIAGTIKKQAIETWNANRDKSLAEVKDLIRARVMRNVDTCATTITSAVRSAVANDVHDMIAPGRHHIWRTMRDDKVRDDHADLEGVQDDDDGNYDTNIGSVEGPCMSGDPDFDINCRCWEELAEE